MKRTRRTIKDDFPTGSLDRDELRRAFLEVGAKRRERERRRAMRADNHPGASSVRDHRPVATSRAVQDENRAA